MSRTIEKVPPELGLIPGTKEYKNYVQKRRRERNKKPSDKPKKKLGRPKKTDSIQIDPAQYCQKDRTLAEPCLFCKTEARRDPISNKLLNGDVFMNTVKNNRIVRAFVCEGCL